MVSEEWMIADMRGRMEPEQILSKTIGRGSSWEVDGFDLWMRSKITEAGVGVGS